MFCKSYIQYKTLGYNTSSPAESTNNRFKRYLREKISFKTIREWFDISMNESNKNHEDKLYRFRIKTNNFPLKFDQNHLSKICIAELQEVLVAAVMLKVKSNFRNASELFVSVPLSDMGEKVTIRDDMYVCSCNQRLMYGYICEHIMACLLYHNKKPI